jgi:peptidoglycan-associated lipoprotein
MRIKILFLSIVIMLQFFKVVAQENVIKTSIKSTCVGSVIENNSTAFIRIPACEIKVTKSDGTNFILITDSLGNFQFPLDSNSNYMISARSNIKYTEGDIYRKGKQKYFRGKNLLISTVGLTESKNFECLIRLDTLSGCGPFFSNIEYENNTTFLSPESKLAVNVLLEILTENQTMSVEIKSFTDYKGDTKINDKLSQDRADVVLKYLSEKGIDKNRILAKGYGESTPKIITVENFRYIPEIYRNHFPIGSVLDEKFIASLKTAELIEFALKLNRRTEFQVLCTDWSTGRAPDFCVKKN